MASASRVSAAGWAPEPMTSGAIPRERGSAAALFLRLGLPSLLPAFALLSATRSSLDMDYTEAGCNPAGFLGEERAGPDSRGSSPAYSSASQFRLSSARPTDA